MTIWRIKNGLPSVADGLLVAGGMIGGINLLSEVFDPVLNYFEPRGLLYVGYAILFVAFGALGGLGIMVFLRNQNKLRDEIRVPRLVFAFAIPPLFLLFNSIAISLIFPYIIRENISIEKANYVISLALIVGFALVYAVIVRAALRWPTRTTWIALWCNVGMAAIGVTAKIIKIIFYK